MKTRKSERLIQGSYPTKDASAIQKNKCLEIC